jgi:hypothetical protein
MKAASVLLMTFAFLLYSSVVGSSDFEDAVTPIEQDDMKSIDEINKEPSDVFEATPAEQDDLKTIDEINKGSSDAFEATPIEQNDIKTIDQLNN